MLKKSRKNEIQNMAGEIHYEVIGSLVVFPSRPSINRQKQLHYRLLSILFYCTPSCSWDCHFCQVSNEYFLYGNLQLKYSSSVDLGDQKFCPSIMREGSH